MLGAVAQLHPDVAPAEGAGSLWNVHISVRPIPGAQAGPGERMQSAEMLLFSSGGSGARPTRDGMNATAFPSVVMGMSIEALEQTGPVVFWRKELREGSGGPGKYRGGLGQVIEIGAADGHHFHFNAMFDRVDHPARGRAAAAPERRAVSVSTTARRCAQRAGNMCRRSAASYWSCQAAAASATPRPAAPRRRKPTVGVATWVERTPRDQLNSACRRSRNLGPETPPVLKNKCRACQVRLATRGAGRSHGCH